AQIEAGVFYVQRVEMLGGFASGGHCPDSSPNRSYNSRPQLSKISPDPSFSWFDLPHHDPEFIERVKEGNFLSL
ncbi:MAG: hypothetical protein ACREOR_04270, partial [Candidatus Binatia bacterium]